jgi:uncharacterized membrane protein YbhN (UPF0104 family)
MQPTAPPKPNRWWLRGLVSVAVLAWLVYRIDWRPLAQTLGGLHLGGWLAALLFYVVAQAVSSLRWKMLAEPLGFAVPYRRYVALYYTGMFFNLFLPTSMGGDVVRAWALAGGTGGPGRRLPAMWSVISERMSGLIALVALACLASLCYRGPLPAETHVLVWGAAAGLAAGLALLPTLGRWSPKLRTVAEGLSVCRGQRRRWLAALGLAVIVQVASTGQIVLVGHALGLNVPLLGYAVVVPLVSLATMLPVSLNGVGIREGGLVLLLAPLGVSEPQAVALGLAWFGLTLAMGLIGGGVFSLTRASDPSIPHLHEDLVDDRVARPERSEGRVEPARRPTPFAGAQGVPPRAA